MIPVKENGLTTVILEFGVRRAHGLLFLSVALFSCAESESESESPEKKPPSILGESIAPPKEESPIEVFLRQFDRDDFVPTDRETRVVWEYILSLDNWRRSGWAQPFFEKLAERNPGLAAQLLPRELSGWEQAHWAVPIAPGFIKNREFKNATQFLNTAFASGARATAITACIKAFGDDTTFDEAIQFWELLEKQGTSDSTTGGLASFLTSHDPLRALEWYESLDSRRAKSNAIEGLIADSRDTVEMQLDATKDESLRIRLATAYGGFLRFEGLTRAQAIEELKELPPNLVTRAERAYVSTLSASVGDFAKDYEAVEQYTIDGLTSEGRDVATLFLAMRAFWLDEVKGMNMYLESGLSERMPDQWEVAVERWLLLDSRAASTFILGMQPATSREVAIDTLVAHLEREGDQEAADRWRKEK